MEKYLCAVLATVSSIRLESRRPLRMYEPHSTNDRHRGEENEISLRCVILVRFFSVHRLTYTSARSHTHSTRRDRARQDDSTPPKSSKQKKRRHKGEEKNPIFIYTLCSGSFLSKDIFMVKSIESGIFFMRNLLDLVIEAPF